MVQVGLGTGREHIVPIAYEANKERSHDVFKWGRLLARCAEAHNSPDNHALAESTSRTYFCNSQAVFMFRPES
jgi:hypothetical protein